MEKEMTAVEYLKIRGKMSNNCCECAECPLSDERNGTTLDCGQFETTYPERAVAIAQEWMEEHPPKMLKDDFFEKFPHAPTINGTTPCACAKDCYPVTCLKEGHTVLCEKCWERPLEVEA